jgi:hypothetical protein
VRTPQFILDDPDFKVLTALAGAHEALVNDMYSYGREAKDLEQEREKDNFGNGAEEVQDQVYFLYNAACVLLREAGVDSSNVMNRLKEHIRKTELDFNATVEKLMIRYDGSATDLGFIRDWALLLNDIMAGNYVWCEKSPRYNVV